MIAIVNLLLTFCDEVVDLGRPHPEVLRQLHLHPVDGDVLDLVVELELPLATLLGKCEVVLVLLLDLGVNPLNFNLSSPGSPSSGKPPPPLVLGGLGEDDPDEGDDPLLL
jgi:hypothetical protein